MTCTPLFADSGILSSAFFGEGYDGRAAVQRRRVHGRCLVAGIRRLAGGRATLRATAAVRQIKAT